MNNLVLKNNARREGPLRKIVIGYNTNYLLELGFLGRNVYVLKDSPIQKFLPNSLIIDSVVLIIPDKVVIIITSKWLAFVDNHEVMEVQRVARFDASFVLERDSHDRALCNSVFKLIESIVYVQL